MAVGLRASALFLVTLRLAAACGPGVGSWGVTGGPGPWRGLPGCPPAPLTLRPSRPTLQVPSLPVSQTPTQSIAQAADQTHHWLPHVPGQPANTVNKTFLERKFILPVHPISLSLLAPSSPVTRDTTAVATTSEWQCQLLQPFQSLRWPTAAPQARMIPVHLGLHLTWATPSRLRPTLCPEPSSPDPRCLVISRSSSHASFLQGGARDARLAQGPVTWSRCPS